MESQEKLAGKKRGKIGKTEDEETKEMEKVTRVVEEEWEGRRIVT